MSTTLSKQHMVDELTRALSVCTREADDTTGEVQAYHKGRKHQIERLLGLIQGGRFDSDLLPRKQR